MDIVADGQIIGAVGEDVAALAVVGGGIPAGQEILVHRDGDGFGVAGLEQAGLGKARQLNRGLFHLVLPLIVAVGGLGVELNHGLSGHVAGIRGGGCHRDLILPHADAVQGLGEGGVAEAEAEGELHLFRIAPGSGAGQGAGGAVRVPLTHDGVRVAGLIVAVADIDVFRLEGDVLRVLIRVDGADDGVRIGKLRGIGAGVHGGGSGEGAGGVGIHQMAGGVHNAAENFGHAHEALMAGGADEHQRVAVGENLVDLHLVGAVQEDDDLVKILPHQDQEVLLVLVQGQRAHDGHAVVVHVLHGHVGALCALPGEDDDGSVVVGVGPGGALPLIEGRVLLRTRRGAGGSRAAPASASAAGFPGGGLSLQSVPESAVDLEALTLQRLSEVDNVQSPVRGLGAGGSALIDGVHRCVAEYGHPGFGIQGQHAVVEQQRSSLPHLIDVLLKGSGEQGGLGRGIVEAAEGALEVGGVAGLPGQHNPGGCGAQRGVDIARVGECQALPHHRNDKNHCKDGGQA